MICRRCLRNVIFKSLTPCWGKPSRPRAFTDGLRAAYTSAMPAVAAALPTTLIAPGDLPLQLNHWPVKSPRGVVQTLHGFGEHQGRFDRLARVLNQAGWAVAGIDYRAHGRSGGERGVIASPTDLLHDQALLHDQLSQHYRTLPHVFIGTSLGGLLAAQFAAAQSPHAPDEAWSRPTNGVVLIAPALAPTLPGPQSATLSVLQRLVPDLHVSLAHLQSCGNSDPKALAAKRADPLIHTRLTPRMCQFMLQTAQRVAAHAAEWTVPTLLSFTDQDRLVPAVACTRFADRLPPELLTTVRYADMAHDLLHEPCADELAQRITTWLDAL